MSDITFTNWQHPGSGETFAVMVDGSGRIIEAAGPLHHSDPRTTDALAAPIANNPEAKGDGAWLEVARLEQLDGPDEVEGTDFETVRRFGASLVFSVRGEPDTVEHFASPEEAHAEFAYRFANMQAMADEAFAEAQNREEAR